MDRKYTNESLHTTDKSTYLPTFKRFPLAFIKARGCKMWDANGKEYLDMLAGIAVNNVGHCHPHVVKRVQEQAAELMHISNFFVSPPQVALAEKLTQLSGLGRIFFSNSGAEAVEGAIKIARKYGSKNGKDGTIISMHNSFHGRTLATIATGQAKYQKGFEPIPIGFEQLAFNDFEALKAVINEKTTAVILEPIQGEGGIRPAEKSYLQKVRQLCDENNVLLIFDEIQCGVARTGKMFAKEHYDIQPDIMTLAKGLGGGAPIGAFLCNEKVAAAIDFGDHGTTFGGNPLVCAAALATLEVIENEKLIEAAETKGNWLVQTFEKMKADFPIIKEVRGKGLMLGVEMSKTAAPLVKMLMDKGIIANATADTVLRLVPPLTISQEELDYFISTLKDCLTEFSKEA